MMTQTQAWSESSLSEVAYADLKRRLMVGRFLPGDKLSIRKLAVEFGTSAMPVREALKRLASERVLESSAGKAYFVPDLDDRRAADLFGLRALLEEAAVDTAMARLRQSTVAELRRLGRRMETCLAAGSFDNYMVDNHRFHFLIYEKSGNPDMVAMIEQLWMQTGPSLHRGLQRCGQQQDRDHDHMRIVDAIAAGNAAEFRSAIRSDIGWGIAVYRGIAGTNAQD